MVILGAVQYGLLDRAGRRDDAGAGRGVFALDVKRVIFGAVANSTVAGLTDADPRELLARAAGGRCAGDGHLSAALTDAMHASVGQLLTQVGHSKLP